jgi:hypothetical protein
MCLFLALIVVFSCRNVSVGACTFWMRVGAMVAPQILQLVSKLFCSGQFVLVSYHILLFYYHIHEPMGADVLFVYFPSTTLHEFPMNNEKQTFYQRHKFL